MAFAHWLAVDYLFFAGYTILQFIVLATAWNILGGYCGYVNFGSAAFFALGAYSVGGHAQVRRQSTHGFRSASPCPSSIFPLPIPVLMVIGGIVSGIVGFGMGYLTLRLRGVVLRHRHAGAGRGAADLDRQLGLRRRLARRLYHPPGNLEFAGIQINYIEYLFALMLLLAVIALTTARVIERSQLGFGFATIRDDELAAEACGVPTLRLKLIATTLSGRLHGHGRRAVPLLHRLFAAGVGLRP